MPRLSSRFPMTFVRITTNVSPRVLCISVGLFGFIRSTTCTNRTRHSVALFSAGCIGRESSNGKLSGKHRENSRYSKGCSSQSKSRTRRKIRSNRRLREFLHSPLVPMKVSLSSAALPPSARPWRKNGVRNGWRYAHDRSFACADRGLILAVDQHDLDLRHVAE